jgi:hypothetical protein
LVVVRAAKEVLKHSRRLGKESGGLVLNLAHAGALLLSQLHRGKYNKSNGLK